MGSVGWITWFLHGILQSILLWAPLIEPLKEDPIPHPWFDPCEIYALWASLLDPDSRPTSEFMDLYWDCLWSKFRGGIVDQYLTAIFNALQPVWQTFGDLGEEFGSVSEWLWALFFKIGKVLPDWAFDVATGLQHLWELLPESIRDGLLTWWEFIENVHFAIKEWVREYIGWVILLISELYDWYVTLAQFVTNWWMGAHEELNNLLADTFGWVARQLGAAWIFLVWFWDDPTGALTVWLAPWWNQLVTFAGDCLDFWYNLWGSYADDLAEFLADPLEFLWNRGEMWLNRRLGQP